MKRYLLSLLVLAFLATACQPAEATVSVVSTLPTATAESSLAPVPPPSVPPTPTPQAGTIVFQKFATRVKDVVLSPDNQQYALLLSQEGEQPDLLAIYTLDDPSTVLASAPVDVAFYQYGLRYGVHLLHYAPDGQTIFALSEDGKNLQVWNAHTLAPLGAFPLPEWGHVATINAAGDQVAVAGSEHEPIVLLHYPDGELLQTLEPPPVENPSQMAVRSFVNVLFADAQSLIAYTPSMLYRWDLTEAAFVDYWESAPITAVMTAPGGLYLFSPSQTPHLRLMAQTDAQTPLSLPENFPLQSPLVLSPYGQVAALDVLHGGIYLVKTRPDEPEEPLVGFLPFQAGERNPDELTSQLFFSDDGRLLYGIFSNNVQIWRLDDDLTP